MYNLTYHKGRSIVKVVELDHYPTDEDVARHHEPDTYHDISRRDLQPVDFDYRNETE